MAHFFLRINFINRWVENNRGIIIRILVVLGVLVVSVISPKIVQGQRYFLLLLLLILGIGSSIFLLKFKSIGLLGLIPASMVVPFGIGTGTQTKLNAAILLLAFLIGLWLIDMIARERRLLLVSSRTFAPLFLLMLIAFLAFIVGQLPWFNFAQAAPIRAQIGALAIFLLSGGALLLIANQIKDLKILAWMVWIFLALGSIYILSRFLQEIIKNHIPNIFQNGVVQGSLFWTWFIALTFSQALINRKLSPFWRSVLFILVLMTMYICMIREYGWSSGWIPPLAAIAVIIWVYLKRLRVPLLLCAIPIAIFFTTKIASFIMAGDNQYSLTTRLDAWRILWEIIKVNPILGVGPANYYWYTPLFPIAGYSVNFNSHNNYVDLIAQIGLLGMVCFLWVAWELGWLGLKLKESAPEGFAKAYVYGAIGGLAGTLLAGMLGDWIIPFVYNVGYDGFRASILGWIFLGGLISVEQIVRHGEKIPDNTPI